MTRGTMQCHDEQALPIRRNAGFAPHVESFLAIRSSRVDYYSSQFISKLYRDVCPAPLLVCLHKYSQIPSHNLAQFQSRMLDDDVANLNGAILSENITMPF